MTDIEVKCEQCDAKFMRLARIRTPKRLCDTCCHENKKARCRAYKQKNKLYVSEYNAKYKAERKEETSKYNKVYNEVYRQEVQMKQTKRRIERQKEDPMYKALCLMRSRLGKFFKTGSKTKAIPILLACTYAEFILWIKFQFVEGMTMENHGDVWEYDHVIPCTAFDHSIYHEQEKCFHWSNIQPLMRDDNRSKGNKLKRSDIDILLRKIKLFESIHIDKLSDNMIFYDYDRYEYVNC